VEQVVGIYIFLDEEEEAKGLIVFEKGKIISSSFHGLLGKHQLRLKFDKVTCLEITELCFRG